MPFQKEFTMPSEEELTVNEVNLSSSRLHAAAIHLGKYCELENNEFMLCRDELKDPRKCLKEGKAVTDCTYRFFCELKKNCCTEFEQYANCLFKSSSDYGYKHCRNTQAVLDKCLFDKLGWERPPFGWQAELHVHHTDRPKPKPKIAYYPDATDSLPGQVTDNCEKVKYEDPKYGFRS